MSEKIEATDDELEALMAELEAQNAEIAAQQKASVGAEPANDSNPPTDDEVNKGQPVEQSVVEEPETMAASQDEVAAGENQLGQDELAELEAEMQAVGAAGIPAAPVVEEPPPADDGKEGYMSLEGKKIEVNVTIDASAASKAVAAAVKENVAERRVVMNEDGTVKQPNFGVAAPGRQAESLQHYVDVDKFRVDTRVTEATLDGCMLEQSGLRAYYGAQAARAEAQASRVKAKFEVVEATLYDEHRKIMAASGEKTTEKMVENAVKMDRRWIKAKNMVIESESIAAINKSLVQSLADRKDMLVQLGADRREELKGGLRILEDRAERDSLRERALAAGRQAA